jgi:hypothetical protein
VSYTLYNKELLPLLKSTLQDPYLRKKILFGSDFYMVEQEESEREFFINLKAELGQSDFKVIAEENPNTFLFNKIV